LVLGSALPKEITALSNMATTEAAFVAAASDDYHSPSSPPLDQGDPGGGAHRSRRTTRPQGVAYDVGAYEWCTGAAW
jgi:hypothetical protein